MAQTDIKIRLAVPQDVAVIHRLGSEVAEFAVSDDIVTFWPAGVLERALASDDVLILVAETVQVVGFIIVNCSHGLQKALVENIYVHPEVRGQQIGERLLADALVRLQESGIAYVATLVPHDAVAAVRLYESQGFSRGENFLWLDRPLDGSFKK